MTEEELRKFWISDEGDYTLSPSPRKLQREREEKEQAEKAREREPESGE